MNTKNLYYGLDHTFSEAVIKGVIKAAGTPFSQYTVGGTASTFCDKFQIRTIRVFEAYYKHYDQGHNKHSTFRK